MNRLTLELPEPPSLNEMIELAKKRTRRSRTGGWMKKTLPVVYDQEKERYELECHAVTRNAGIFPPHVPWPRWELTAVEFRLHNVRDYIELQSSLKWPIDWLVSAGYVANDSPRELADVAKPVQRIERANRGVTITIVALHAP
jgi:hypothetical protein